MKGIGHFGDFLKTFLKKCINDKTISNGYQETCTQVVTLSSGGPMTVTINSPQLSLYVKQKKELLEDARTYMVDEGLQQGEEGDVSFNFIVCSGYPIEVLPQKSGETVNYILYRINEDKSETELDAMVEAYTEKDLLGNDDMEKTKNKQYEALFIYENAELSKPGTYKLKVSFSWEALNDAELIFDVVDSSSAISECSSGNPADNGMTYDLQGRVVNMPRKGFYIHDGRRIIVR